MRELIKKLIIGSPLEGSIKHLHGLLTGSKSSLYDHQTIEVMRRVLRPGSIAIDVGAFKGGMLSHMVRFAPNSRHFAFEPIPHLAEALARNFPQCEVHQMAVGEAAGTATFHEVVDWPALSGLRRRKDLAEDVQSKEFSVRVDSLDHIIPEATPIALIKIDVEGGEYGVLKGGKRTIRRNRPVIVFECGLGGADTYGTLPQDLAEFVESELGLRIFLLEQWLSGGLPLTGAEFRLQFVGGLNYYFVAAPH